MEQVDVGWPTGLLDCCADGRVCLCGTLCPLCLACHTTKAVSGFGYFEQTTDCLCDNCMCLPCCWPCMPCYTSKTREKIRKQQGIPEGCCPDCMCHLVCFPCAVCQEARTIKIRKADSAVAAMEAGSMEPPVKQEMKAVPL